MIARDIPPEIVQRLSGRFARSRAERIRLYMRGAFMATCSAACVAVYLYKYQVMDHVAQHAITLGLALFAGVPAVREWRKRLTSYVWQHGTLSEMQGDRIVWTENLTGLAGARVVFARGHDPCVDLVWPDRCHTIDLFSSISDALGRECFRRASELGPPDDRLRVVAGRKNSQAGI